MCLLIVLFNTIIGRVKFSIIFIFDIKCVKKLDIFLDSPGIFEISFYTFNIKFQN